MKEKQTAVRPVKFYKQKVGDLAKRLPTVENRFALWKGLMFDKANNSIKLNLVALVCFLPIIAIAVVMANSFNTVSNSLPFSSFIGVGYPTIIDATSKAFTETQGVLLRAGVFTLPVALFISLVLGISVLYATRNFVWTEGDFKFKTLIKAYKFNLQSILIALIVSLVFMGYMYVIYLFRGMLFSDGWTFLTVLALLGIVAVGVILLMVAMYSFSISITYKENVFLVFRDAFVLTFKAFFLNLMITVATFAPIAILILTAGSFLSTLCMMICLFIGGTYLLTVWTVYSQYVFDVFTNAKDKKGSYAK
ncbi:MAG: hypothetical protein IKL61_02405 [Clostridia bacterium]|nr:hypothetical protein [Clostridia bacterium]